MRSLKREWEVERNVDSWREKGKKDRAVKEPPSKEDMEKNQAERLSALAER